MSTTNSAAGMTSTESDLMEAINAALPGDAHLELERSDETGEWGVWLHSDDPDHDADLIGASKALAEALEQALRTVRRWVA